MGWWKGKLGNTIEVLTSNFVELIDEKDVVQAKDTPVETQSEHPGLLLWLLLTKCWQATLE